MYSQSSGGAKSNWDLSSKILSSIDCAFIFHSSASGILPRQNQPSPEEATFEFEEANRIQFFDRETGNRKDDFSGFLSATIADRKIILRGNPTIA